MHIDQKGPEIQNLIMDILYEKLPGFNKRM